MQLNILTFNSVSARVENRYEHLQDSWYLILLYNELYKKCLPSLIQSVLGVKVTTSGFNSRAGSESKTSYTHGSKSQRLRSSGFYKVQ